MTILFKRLLIFSSLAIPFILIYKAFFLAGPLAFGDAPFFASENLAELYNPPFIWNNRNDNFGNPQYYILWLYLPTFLYGIFHHFFVWGNDFLIRLIFYFPATILAIIGSWLFIGKFNQSLVAKFLGTFLYGFNTYFLMLIDGGQVGVALAYGLFPLAATAALNFFHKFDLKNYLYCLITLFALISADLRIALIFIFFIFLVGVIKEKVITKGIILKFLTRFLFLGIAVAGLSAYWLLPIISALSLGNLNNISDLSNGDNFINLINSLLFFQPHFPLNQFGKILAPPFYFVFLPIFIFGSIPLLFKFKEFTQIKIILKFSVIFLLFAFLAKGDSEPVGQIYSWFINLPGGVAFRDSSKFFMPLILSGGVLLSFTIQALEKFFKQKAVWVISVVVIYGYLLILIHPALLGNLMGALGERETLGGNDYQQFSNFVRQEPGFIKSLYFTEKPAQFYATWEKPALSANNLYKERPFASMNVGQYDLQNFLHSPQILQWLKLLGVKYLLFPENERKKIWTMEEEEERVNFLQFIETIPGLGRVDWSGSFPLYKLTDEAAPPVFAQKKIFLVIGNESIYQDLIKIPNFSLVNQGFVFLEEGRVDPQRLMEISPEAAVLIFAKKSQNDLTMSFLQYKMVAPSQALENQWMIRASSDYLIWKYDLLKQGIESFEFDFGQGIAFSTIAQEKIKFKLDVPQQGNYYLTIRFTNATESSGLNLSFLGQSYNLKNDQPENFKWQTFGPFDLEKGRLPVEIMNLGGFGLFNTLALVSEEDLSSAEKQSFQLTSYFKVIHIKSDGDWPLLTNEFKNSYLSVSYQQINPTQYKIYSLPKEASWLIFSDHYHEGWQLESDSIHLPFYSMINGFYLNKPEVSTTLIFAPQKEIPKGIFLSVIILILICLSSISLFVRSKSRRKSGNEV